MAKTFPVTLILLPTIAILENREPLQLELKNYSKIATLFTVLMMYINYTLPLLVPLLSQCLLQNFGLCALLNEMYRLLLE